MEPATILAISSLVHLLSSRLGRLKRQMLNDTASASDEIAQAMASYNEVLNRAAKLVGNPELVKRIDSNETKQLERWLDEIKAADEFKHDELARMKEMDRRLQEMVER